MGSARATIAAGAAAFGGAALLLVGGVPGSAVTAVALVLVARAAAASAAEAPAVAARALSRQFTTAPVWVAIIAVGAMRAGSIQLGDLRGANAVAGPAISHGEPLSIIAVWLAIVAGIVAVSAAAGAGGGFNGTVAPEGGLARLDAAAATLQIILLVTLFVGPQISDPIDIAPWIVAVIVGIGASWFARRATRWDRADLIAFGPAVLAFVLMAAAPKL